MMPLKYPQNMLSFKPMCWVLVSKLITLESQQQLEFSEREGK